MNEPMRWVFCAAAAVLSLACPPPAIGHEGEEVEEIAVKEHLATAVGIHPRKLPEALPLTRFDYTVTRDGDDVCVRTGAPPSHFLVVAVAEFADTLSMRSIVRIIPIETTFWERLDGRIDLGFNCLHAKTVGWRDHPFPVGSVMSSGDNWLAIFASDGLLDHIKV